MNIDLKQVFVTLVVFCIVVAMCMLQSCKTIQYVPVEHTRDSIQYVAKHDTTIIHIKDSSERYKSNDTIYLTMWKTRLETRITHDTINVATTEQIPVIQEVEKPVVPSWCWWLLAVVVGYGVYKVGRLAIKIYAKVQSGGLL